MAEKTIQNENLKKLNELLGDESFNNLFNSIKGDKETIKDIKGKLDEKIKAFNDQKEKEELLRKEAEERKLEETKKSVEPEVKVETPVPVKREEPVKKEERKEYVSREERKPNFNKEGAPRRERPVENKPFNNKPNPQKNFVPKNVVMEAPIPQKASNFNNNKKKNQERPEEKRMLNKRALIKNQVSIDDFDEDKSGYRKFRPVKKQKAVEEKHEIKIERAFVTSEIIPLKVLSEKLGVSAIEITKKLFKEGIMKTINDSIDYDTAAILAADMGIELELKLEKTAESVLSEAYGDENDENAVKRSPVVSVMGHVDHGKTSLLDRIRKTNVTSGEAGGITQHIGAYQVSIGGKQITFLDTPGHAAFTSMRQRGAQATDIAVIVIAADDGIMPQTIEAINHARAADVQVIVAVNKIDKPEANLDRVKTQLTEQGLVPEEWGGDIIVCPVSAKTGEGINELLEAINLIAELKELKANPNRNAKGIVIEAKLDNSKGPIATVLIQNGTLKMADSVVVGTVTGKIRAMIDDKGRKINTAGPSVPVSIMGLSEVPNAGDILYAVEEGKLTKMVAEERKEREKLERQKQQMKVSLDDVFNRIAEGQIKGLNIIVKADVQGSVEAVRQAMEKLSNEEVRVNVIHAAAGAITETDIMLADSSNAIIIGFNVRPDSNAKQIAERSGVDIKLYRIIYEAIEDVEKALKGMLAPKYKETYMGKAEVRNTFNITGVGMVAGCYVKEGKIVRNGKLRIYRNDIMICEGNVLQLKRFKDDVKEVAQGFECGISIEKFNDIKNDDFIECYVIEEVEQ
ncbi:MAG: translation initiation factor IF-2 [Clostridiales bacterium]|nr:translation initiation factor IF-2 [Clostridiales bacterium]